TWTGRAPAGGVGVPLTSGNPAVTSIPAYVVIGPGGTSANAAIYTSGTVTTATSGPITATYNGSAAATLTVTPPLQVSSLTVSPASVVGGTAGTGAVRVN